MRTVQPQINHRFQEPIFCNLHRKKQEFFVVSQAKFICEDCAIFQRFYKSEILFDKQSFKRELQKANKLCQSLTSRQEANADIKKKRIEQVLRQIERSQVSLINNINNQFVQIKIRLSSLISSLIKITPEEDLQQFEKILNQIKTETTDSQKVSIYHQKKELLDYYQFYMEIQFSQTKQLFDFLQQSIADQIKVKVDVLAAFEPLMNFNPASIHNDSMTNLNDDNLLDFAEYEDQEINECNYRNSIQTQSFLYFNSQKDKRNESIKKTHHLHHNQSTYPNKSLINSIIFNEDIHYQISTSNDIKNLSSEESALSTLVTSRIRKQQMYSNPVNQSTQSQKSTLQIKTLQQLNTKLNSIPSMTKTIKISSVTATSQEFSHILKSKISSSFIKNLQFVDCPKINQKFLFDLKTHKPKTLKKVQLKNCSELNWESKKVKELIKKLQTEGLAIIR